MKKPRTNTGLLGHSIERFRLAGVNAHKLAVLRALLFEFDVTVGFCIKRMVPADPYIDTRMKPRAALAHDDIARNNLLTAVYLHAQAFGFGVATVLATTACFFMSHFAIPVLPRLYFVQAL